MQRYKVSTTRSNCGPPQYLGGVGEYDVFYWTAAHDGNERLIVKWGSSDYWFYFWDFEDECWRDQYSTVPTGGPSTEQTETILAMYQCFALKPCSSE